MSYSPGFRKTHEYGQPFPDPEVEAAAAVFEKLDVGIELPAEAENWAGRGFDKPVVELDE